MFLGNGIPVDWLAQFFDLLTIIILLYVTVKYISKVFEETRILVFMIFFMFYILPLVLDYIVGFPEYFKSNERFAVSQKDLPTRIVYDFCLMICTWIILNYKKTKTIRLASIATLGIKTSKKINVALIVGMLLPVVFVLLLNMPSFMLVVPMWREIEFVEVPQNYSLVEQLDFAGVCCCILCLFGKYNNNSFPIRLISLILLYCNICIEGKRGIIFFTLLCVVLLWIVRQHVDKLGHKEKLLGLLKIVTIGAAAIVVMIIMSVNVKIGRGYEDDPMLLYTSMRIDFLRDDRVRLAIYEFVHPDSPHVLDYPGQTIWPFITWLFPLNILFLKLYNFSAPHYSYFLSSALLGGNISKEESFMTPSVFGELISNFSYFGIIVFILFTIWFIKKADRFPYPINLFIIIAFTAWQMYPLGYIMLFLEFTFVLCVLYRIRSNKRRTL